jgi:diguanylate cyclase (GGDEF)-like protein
MTSFDPADARLLIVDDVAENRDVLSKRFVRRGFQTVEAEDGAKALDLIGKEHFDLVLLDILMPGIDGIEVLKRVRAVHSPADLPVVMVTAKTATDSIVQALELGANDYIPKPVDFAVAFARIRNQLAWRQAQQKLAHLAYHDPLTGLGNRALLREQLVRALGDLDRHGARAAVLFIDLCSFTLINNTLGHRVGDLILTAVGERLRDRFGDTATVARAGGDEFAIIQPMLAGPDEAFQLANRIQEAIGSPYDIEGHHVVLDSNIGIALASDDGRDPEILLSNADLALYHAISEGRRGCRIFEPEMNTRAQTRRLLELSLRAAFLAGDFEPFYQPLFNLVEGRVSGFEALLRWNHPARGIVSPSEFIPVAEDIGLIVQLGEWLLRQSCVEAARWPHALKLAINLSPVQFRSGNLTQAVTTALAESGLPPDRLELEITETALLDNNEKTLHTLHQLRGMGVRISLDDFGTGYSSLSYLCTFPFDKIKIDRTFIHGSSFQPRNLHVIHAITGLAKGLGMITTAQGVETQEQLEYLRAEGCTEVQGYLISPAVPAGELQRLLAKLRCPARKVA